jgi:aryl-alcohol dehydrogenase-like predicted oxidoreductase
MNTRRLGDSDLYITPVGFGAWAPGEGAVAWVLSNPPVTAAIVGARRPDQVRGLSGAADLRLSNRELAEIEALSARAVG